MTPELGHALVVLALAVALAGAGFSFLAPSAYPELLAWSRRACFALAALLLLIVALMLFALVTHDFSVRYVFQVGSRETPLYYTISSLWGALEGSILYWALLLSLYTAAFAYLNRTRSVALQSYANGILLVILAFFLFVVAGPGNPFQPVSPVPRDGLGPNVLLQNHWMMGVHPQLLYLGYVGLAAPYALAMGGLLSGGLTTDLLRSIRRWALVPWIFLSLGIVAGMWWSYAVLGWGGYWAWDPVENASVMPWLVTTAFLHSLQVQERRQMLKAWTVSLIIAAFLLSILGTFLTRSGVIVSVHSFTRSSIGPIFLTFLAVALFLSLSLLFARLHQLRPPTGSSMGMGRELAFLLNNVLLVGATFTILLGTLFPVIAEAAKGTALSVGAPYFNQVNVPIGVALLFLMGVGPALRWATFSAEELQWRLLVPVATAAAVIFLLLALGLRGITPLLTFGLATFVLMVTLARMFDDSAARARNTGEGNVRTIGRLIRTNPRRYGGYLAHLGVLLIVVGIAASQAYQVRGTATLRSGQSFSVDGYRMTYHGLLPRPEPNRMVLIARFQVGRDGHDLTALSPSLNYYRGRVDQPVVTPAIFEQPWSILSALWNGRSLPDVLHTLLRGHNAFEDLYFMLQGIDPKTGAVTVQALVNPLVSLIWLGGMVVGTGGVLALLPARRRRAVVVTQPAPLFAEEATA